MNKVVYRIRYIFDYKAVDHYDTFLCDRYFISGEIYYFRNGEFNIRAISKDDIVSITSI